MATQAKIADIEKDESTESSLPEGWAQKTINQLITEDGLFSDGDWIETKSQDPKGGVRLIQLADVGDGLYRDKSNRYLTEETARDLKCTFLQAGDVLIARMPDPLGRACIFPGDEKPAVTAVDVCIIRMGSQKLSQRWIMHFVNSPKVRSRMENFAKGTTRKRISRKNIGRIQVPVPPQGEQARIAELADLLIAKVNDEEERLRRIEQLLDRFRQSVLAAACSGRLTEDWRAANPSVEFNQEAKEILRVDLQESDELPTKWLWTYGEKVYEEGRYGTSKKCTPQPEGIPVLRVPNIAKGQLDLKDLKYTHLAESELDKITLQPGDILICRTNGSLDLIGKAAVIPEMKDDLAFASYLIRVRLQREFIDPDYYHIFVSSRLGRDQIEKRARTTAGQFNLNLGILRGFEIPLAPIKEQKEIVRRVEALFQFADSIEDKVKSAKGRAEKLTQAILAKAFRGELVPTEAELARREGRDYETAEELLGRIGSRDN